MKIEMESLERCSISDFADKYGLTMVVGENGVIRGNRYSAKFKGCLENDGRVFLRTSGIGGTVNEAIADYARRDLDNARICYAAIRGSICIATVK